MDCQNQCTPKNEKCQKRWIARIIVHKKMKNAKIGGFPKTMYSEMCKAKNNEYQS